MSGSYDAAGAARPRPRWWPADYVDWMPHSFVECAGGAVADVSADQFDADVPMLHVCERGDAAHGRFASSKASPRGKVRRLDSDDRRFSKAPSHAARRARFEFRRPDGAPLSMAPWNALTKSEPSHSDVVRSAWATARSKSRARVCPRLFRARDAAAAAAGPCTLLGGYDI